MLIEAPKKYRNERGETDRVYDALCKVLSGREMQVAWGQFGEAEWQLLPRLAAAEGVGPLVYWRYREGNWPAGCPAEAVAELMGQYFRTRQRNEQLLAELERVAAAFHEANIDIVLLKGAHLVQALYPDIGLRPMEDLDILIRHEDRKKAFALARQLGYEEYIPEMIPRLNQETGHHYHLKNRNGSLLELHWNLISGSRGDFRTPPEDWFWAESTSEYPWKHSRYQARSLNLAANLLYLSAHIALQHGMINAFLFWFFDIHLLIQETGSSMDWGELAEKAGTLGWNPVLNTVLAGVKERFATTIPGEYIQTTDDETEKMTALIHSGTQRLSALDRAYNTLAPYRGITKIKVLLGHLLPRPALIRYLYHPNPTWLWPFYYLVRWWEIARKIFSSLYNARREKESL